MKAPLALRALVLAATLAIATGCGGGDDNSPGDVRANGTDAAFVNAIIPHHEAAVDAADLALSRAQHRQLEQLAEEMLQLQSTELATLRAVRDVLQEAEVEEGDLGLSEAGTDHDPAALRNAANFDCAFLEFMIPHQEAAIRMARAELESGIHAELRRLSSNDIIDTQGFQLRQMKRYQSRWCGG